MSPARNARLHATWHDAAQVLGVDPKDRQERLAYLSQLCGRTIASTKDLTNRDLDHVLTELARLADPDAFEPALRQVQHAEDPDIGERRRLLWTIERLAAEMARVLGMEDPTGWPYARKILAGITPGAEPKSFAELAGEPGAKPLVSARDLTRLRNTLSQRVSRAWTRIKRTAREELEPGETSPRDPDGKNTFRTKKTAVQRADYLPADLLTEKQRKQSNTALMSALLSSSSPPANTVQKARRSSAQTPRKAQKGQHRVKTSQV